MAVTIIGTENYAKMVTGTLIKVKKINIAIVGGGRQGVRLIELLQEHEFYEIQPEIKAVADINPDAPGMVKARQRNIYTTNDYCDIFKFPDIELIVELTGDQDVFQEILKQKDPKVRAISSNLVKIFWEISRISTSEKKVRQELHQANEMYKMVINDLIHEDVLVINFDHHIVDANKSLLEKLGLTRDEVIGRYCYEITHHRNLPCSGDNHPCPLQETLESDQPYQTTHVHLDKNNREIYYAISTYPLFEDGDVIGAIEILRDITKAVRRFQGGDPDLISRFIEFPEEYHQAGVDILNYFSRILHKRYPESNAKVRIEQDGLKVRMVIDPVDGEKEVIEETLKEYGLVIFGKMTPEEFSDDKCEVIELKAELRMAKLKIDFQRDLLGNKDCQIDKLLSFVGSAIQKESPPPQITIVQDKADKTTVHRTSAGNIYGFVQAKLVKNINQKREENMGDTYSLNAKGDIVFGKDQAIVTLNKTISNADIPKNLEKSLEQLTAIVDKLIAGKTLPEEQTQNITANLERFVNEVAKPQPEQKWCEITGKGLIEAAQAVGAVAKPIIDTTRAVLKLLGLGFV